MCRTTVLDSKEVLTNGALLVSRDWAWSRGISICKEAVLFMSIFPVWRGGEEGPVLTLIVAGEDMAIFSHQRSPTYLFDSCTLGASALNSRFWGGRWEGVNLPELVFGGNLEPLTLISFTPLCSL